MLLLFQLYTAVRPSEARLATWNEIDLEKGIWKIPANRMKNEKPHWVTFSKQILKALKEFKGNKEKGLCFTGQRGIEISRRTINSLIKSIGYENIITPHGFRGTFPTIANDLRDEHGLANDIVQVCLAHQTQNKVASAYNHSDHKKERAKLLGWWADKLGEIDFKKLKENSIYRVERNAGFFL